MASWRPKTDFEDEIVSMQPDHVFIYGELTDQQRRLTNGYQARPSAHLNFLNSKSKKNSQEIKEAPTDFLTASSSSGHSLDAIRAVHKIVGTKQMGEHASIDDWNTSENAERETIAMIRHFGMGPSLDFPLNEKTTIPTLPVNNKKVHIVRNGRKVFPVILDDDYFAIETTRMKNARLRKELNLLSDEVDNLDLNEIEILNEDEEEIKTKEELKEEEKEKYAQEYPALGAQKNKLSKIDKEAANTATTSGMKSFKFNKNDILSPISRKNQNNFKKTQQQSPNTSISSESFCSFKSFGDNSDSSLYLSMNNSDNSSISSKSSYNDKKNLEFKQKKRYYTPKEIYDMKRGMRKKNEE